MNKKQLPAVVRFFLGLVSVILCIVLFACSLVTILVADLSLLTSKDGLQQLIQDVLLSTSAPARPGFASATTLNGGVAVPLSTSEDDAMGGIDFGSLDLSGIISGDNSSGAVADMLYGILEEQFPEELPFSKEEVTNFVEESTLTEFISDKVSGIVVDVINGEVTTTITKEDVVTLLEENKQLIEDTFKIEVPDEVIESVGTFVEESKLSETIQQSISEIVGVEEAPKNDMEVLENVTSGNVDDMGIGEILALVRIITSPAVLIGCIAVCLLISALLFLTNWGRPNAALRCSGISYFLAGLLFLLPSAVAQFVPSIFTGMGIPGVVSNAIRQVLSLAGTISLGVTVFGLALIIGGAIWGSALKKKRIAAAAAEATVADEVSDLAEVLLAAEAPAEANKEVEV